MNLPKDDYLLFSVVNTKLRDNYSSPEELCEEEEWGLDELLRRIEKAGYYYDEKNNTLKQA